MIQLARTIIDLLGSSSTIEHRPLPTDDPTRRRPDITVARAELGWEPTTSLEDGLSPTAAYLAEDAGIAGPADVRLTRIGPDGDRSGRAVGGGARVSGVRGAVVENGRTPTPGADEERRCMAEAEGNDTDGSTPADGRRGSAGDERSGPTGCCR